MTWTVATYLAYLLVVVPLTVWVAQTLSRHGLVFLEDVFDGSPGLAPAVNRLLVVGFYLLNLGFVSLYLRTGGDVVDLRGLIEELSVKVGVVTLVLGVVHVLNVWVFTTMRRRHRIEAFRMSLPPMQPLPPAATYAAPCPAPGR